MTPAQQQALQALAGRALSAGDIEQLDALLADPDNRNDVAIAAVLSAGRVRVQSRLIGIGTILATLGPAGGPFLDGLVQIGATDRNVYWAMELVKAGTLDIGMQATRDQVQALAEAMPGIAGAIAALLALAEVPEPVHYNQVSDALNLAEGRMTL